MVKDYVSLKTLFPKLPSSYMCFSKPVIPRQVSCVPEILLCTSFNYVQPKKERKKESLNHISQKKSLLENDSMELGMAQGDSEQKTQHCSRLDKIVAIT